MCQAHTTHEQVAGWERTCKRERDQKCRKLWERRELTGLQSLQAQLCPPGPHVWSRLDQETAWWHHRRGDTAGTSPLMPNLIVLQPCCYFPIHCYASKGPAPPHFLRRQLPRCHSQNHFLLPLFIPCHTSLHHPSPTLVPLSLSSWGLVPSDECSSDT